MNAMEEDVRCRNTDPLRCLPGMGLMWNYPLTGLSRELLRMNCKG